MSGPIDFGGEEVAGTAHGSDKRRIVDILFDFAAKAIDQNVDTAVGLRQCVAVDKVDELFAAGPSSGAGAVGGVAAQQTDRQDPWRMVSAHRHRSLADGRQHTAHAKTGLAISNHDP